MSRCPVVSDNSLQIFYEDNLCQVRTYDDEKPIVVCIPMTADGKAIGVLSLDFFRAEPIANDEIKLLLAIANIIASAVYRTRLYNNLLKEKELLEYANKEIKNLNAELNTKLQELKNTQEQLLHAQKQEAIGRLAGGIAHDFNNILVAVIGYSELASAALPEEHPVKEYIKKVLDAAQKAASLTKQILVFSRKQTMDTEIVSLSDIIKNFYSMLKALLPENIEVRQEYSGDKCKVEANQLQIEQVIMNLVINARDAMPDGGILEIETGSEDIDAEYAHAMQAEKGRYAFIKISDTGVGMTDEVRQKIFEPFLLPKKERGERVWASQLYMAL